MQAVQYACLRFFGYQRRSTQEKSSDFWCFVSMKTSIPWKRESTSQSLRSGTSLEAPGISALLSQGQIFKKVESDKVVCKDIRKWDLLLNQPWWPQTPLRVIFPKSRFTFVNDIHTIFQAYYPVIINTSIWLEVHTKGLSIVVDWDPQCSYEGPWGLRKFWRVCSGIWSS